MHTFLRITIYLKKKCHFICVLQKSLYLCICKRKNERKTDMITLNTLVNLAVLHIIRVVVVAPRGEKVSCM